MGPAPFRDDLSHHPIPLWTTLETISGNNTFDLLRLGAEQAQHLKSWRVKGLSFSNTVNSKTQRKQSLEIPLTPRLISVVRCY